MKANPGGQIDLGEVVGRDDVIQQIWDILDQQSICINAERRIGKTTVIKKLRAEPRSNWVPIFQDLEQYHTALDFAQSVYHEVERFLSARQRISRKTRALLKTFGGTEVGGVFRLPQFGSQPPWKELLSNAVHDLIDEQEKRDERPLFLWDEVPYMLSSICSREGETVAMEVLDTLRAFRQDQGDNGLRMVLTGSIGIHHVIRSLKGKNYANAPLNDTYSLEIEVLESASAIDLATKLLKGEALNTPEPSQVADAIAQASDGFPFYIHHIVKAIKLSGRDATREGVDQIVTRNLLAPNDPWELNHYRDRIPVYYGKDNETGVLGILDGIAVRADPVSVGELLNELKGMGIRCDREQLIGLLKSIEQDHYLSRDDLGHFRFRFPLLKRWWKLSRGL